jgi:hypothetical protein
MKLLMYRSLLTLAAIVCSESTSPAAIMRPALDDRTYDDLVTESVSRIPTHTPEWTNYRASDPGFRLLDFFRLTDQAVLDGLLVEYHEKPFWSGLPLEGEAYRGQFAYTWLDAALTSAEDPTTVRSADWLADNGINPNWTFNELLAVANVPEPASALLLMVGMISLNRRIFRRGPKHWQTQWCTRQCQILCVTAQPYVRVPPRQRSTHFPH